MNLLLNRLYDSGDSTAGILYFKTDKLRYIWTLEDTYNKDKIPGSTRIPAGQYEITLRREGSHFESYCKHENKIIADLTQKYGILHLQDVPNFEFILIHIGNSNKDTKGCLLTGNNIDNLSDKGGLLTNSTSAYVYLIQNIFPRFNSDKQVIITILDTDKEIEKQFS